jgi:hypothetical protein
VHACGYSRAAEPTHDVSMVAESRLSGDLKKEVGLHCPLENCRMLRVAGEPGFSCPGTHYRWGVRDSTRTCTASSVWVAVLAEVSALGIKQPGGTRG